MIRHVNTFAVAAWIGSLWCGGVAADEVLRPAASGTSRYDGGLYSGVTNATYGVNAAYDSFFSFFNDYRGTVEFPLSNFPAVVQSAKLRMIVQSRDRSGDCVYRLFPYSADGNGAVEGADYYNIGVVPIGVLYSNAVPDVGTTNETVVTAAFNAAIAAGWSHFGVHTVQNPEYTAASLKFYNSGSGTDLEPVLIVERAGTSPDTPFLDITNANASVGYDVTAYSIGGTNNAHVAGTMSWTNSLSGASGTLAAATPWSIGGIALAVGANGITVAGTNALGQATNDTVTITRGGLGTGVPFLNITNANATVVYDVTSCSIGGTNNAHVAGSLRWTNSLNGASGTLAAATPWSIGGIALAVGANTLTVTGTNALGQATNDTVTVTRDGLGTGVPFLDITNANATVGYDVTAYGIGGTNNPHVVGTLRWTNSLNGASGTLAATTPWSIGGIALTVGANGITVAGTNALGQATNDTVTITRGGLGTGAPFLDITNANASVSYDVTAYSIGGTNNAHVTGTLSWTNSLSGASGALAAATPWSIGGIALAVGANALTVTGSNAVGQAAFDTVVITRDSAPAPPAAGWTNLTTGVSGPAYALALASGGDLYIGGLFTTAGGGSATNVARWNGTSWTSLGGGMSGGNVQALAFGPNGELYAGGGFTSAGGVAASRIAKWTGTAWTNLSTGVSGQVSAMAVATNGDLYVGGAFNTAGGVAVYKVAKWDGTSWSALGGGMNNTVYALALAANGDLYAGGQFTTADSASAIRIARWNGTAWTPLGSGAGNTVRALAFGTDGLLYAGGQFTDVGGVTAYYAAKWDGANWSSLGTGMNGNVYRLAAKTGGGMYAGGAFTTAGSATVNYIAEWDGAAWSGLGGGANNNVWCLAACRT